MQGHYSADRCDIMNTGGKYTSTLLPSTYKDWRRPEKDLKTHTRARSPSYVGPSTGAQSLFCAVSQKQPHGEAQGQRGQQHVEITLAGAHTGTRFTALSSSNSFVCR